MPDLQENDLSFVRGVIDAFASANLDVWLFGGWAEELRGIRPPGPHVDVDLLLRASSFEALEPFLAARPELTVIRAKYFSHKRAFSWNGLRVEVVLVQGCPAATVAFDGGATIAWPDDTFLDARLDGLPVVSAGALACYRREHAAIVHASLRHAGRTP